MDKECIYCGCKEFHFNREKRAVICDLCGHVRLTEQEVAREIEYQRQLQVAYDHLLVGDFDSAKRIAERFLQDRPADKELYEILFASATENYTKDDRQDPRQSAYVAQLREKRSKLGPLSEKMEAYERERINRARRESFDKSFAVIVLIILMLIAIGGVFYCLYSGYKMAALILFGVALLMFCCCYGYGIKNE